VKRTYVPALFGLLATCFGGIHCGAGLSLDPPDGGAEGGGSGQAIVGSGGAGSSNAGQGGDGRVGAGGASSMDAGGEHSCPAQPPANASPCSTRSTCSYPDGVCNCVREERPDSAPWREWSCTPAPGACHHIQPEDGQVCMSLGLRCPISSADGGTCLCVAEDGSFQWRC